MSQYSWSPYVPVAVRHAKAMKKMKALKKKGMEIKPVEIEGRKIAQTFWGEAWCDHLESFSDYQNRLPRGRTYVRNGSVCHLDIDRGEVNAMVIGSRVYNVKITIETLPRKKWKEVKKRCAGQIGSLLELLRGEFSENVMSVVTDRTNGLFPLPGEISMDCSCPDWAVMCKHVAAVLYGVGARLDEEPKLLFLLRGVDYEELIDTTVSLTTVVAGTKNRRTHISDDALTDVFGIEMIELTEDPVPDKAKPAPRRKKTAPKSNKASNAMNKQALKRKPKTGKDKKQIPKVPVPRKPDTKGDLQPITGESVAKLRAKFGMTKRDFAKLLGVSVPSVGNWEKKPGALTLQARTLTAWNEAKTLTKRQARRKLSRDGAKE